MAAAPSESVERIPPEKSTAWKGNMNKLTITPKMYNTTSFTSGNVTDNSTTANIGANPMVIIGTNKKFSNNETVERYPNAKYKIGAVPTCAAKEAERKAIVLLLNTRA